MRTLINPTIQVRRAKKGQQGFYTELEQGSLKIKCISVNGRKRGAVGVVTKDGIIQTQPSVEKHITPDLRKKIVFAAELLYNSTNLIPSANGLIQLM